MTFTPSNQAGGALTKGLKMKRIVPRTVAAMVIAGVCAFSGPPGLAADAGGGKKLLVFILAGQSNMQGQAAASTLAYLPKPPYVPTNEEWLTLTGWLERDIKSAEGEKIKQELLKDPVNQKLSNSEPGKLCDTKVKARVETVRQKMHEEFQARQTNPARLARDKELAAIFASGITDNKVLATAERANAIKSPLEQARAWEEGLRTPIGKRAYIAACGGVRRGDEEGFAAGPLSIGYGARSTAIGPEYAFGIMLEKALEQPVLIIKTSWGGKSLHYDFRPPSAGPYQPTANEQAGLERWQTKKAAWDAYLAGGGTAAAMVKLDKEIRAVENRKRDLQQELRKLPKDQPAAQQKTVSELNAKSREMRAKLVPPPGDMPTRNQAGFYWSEMMGFVNKVLADPKKYHPQYDAQAGYQVAGAVWFQGFNDQFDPEYYGNYGANMVHFIQDLRQAVKEPKMPFVIGVMGTMSYREESLRNQVCAGQRQAAKAPELAGTVAAVESWPLTTPEVSLWRDKWIAAQDTGVKAEIEKAQGQWQLYGSNQGYHYFGSGRFHIRLGDEFATTMLKLMGRPTQLP